MLAEMIVYSNPGVLEFLPALPDMLEKGELKGICCFTFARIERMEWDLERGIITADVRSLRDQTIGIRYRHGLEAMKKNGGPVKVSGNTATIDFEEGSTVHLELLVNPRK